MPPPVVALDYAPQPPRHSGYGAVLIYATFLTGLFYLISVQAGIDSPMREQPKPPEYYAGIATQLVLANGDPHPAEMQFSFPSARSGVPSNIVAATRVYYLAEYLRYPNRVLVGTDDKIVNNEEQLLAAGKMPPAQWLTQHDVTTVYAVFVGFVPELQVLKLR